MVDLDALTVRAARDLLAAGSLSSVELVEVMLERIEETEATAHAYATVMAEQARAAARRADAERRRGAARSPLHGVPFAVKDVFSTHDAPTEAGSRVLAGHVAAQDATAVRLLREAGAVLLGKLVTHEFCCGQNVPPTRNAWCATHYPGGSSAGAGVAVALGSTPAALGTDAGGSVRKPAALNGVVGLKPTFGLISRKGVFLCARSLDQVGIVTRTVEDCSLLLAVLAPGTTLPDLDAGLEGARLGLAEAFFGEELEPDVREPVETAVAELERLGATIVPVELPSLDLALPAGFTILMVEAAAEHRRWLRERPYDYVPETRRMLELGALLPAAHVEAAQRARSLICGEMAEAFRTGNLDALVTPTLPRASIPIDEMVIPRDLPSFIPYTFPANLAGLPALTVPCGFTPAGLPVGLQLIGPPFGEPTLFGLASAYERATPWHERRPAVAVGG
jgi:aspartyl-tRNA(Asn)/glutamyl-tRNA(Gln) amidotransferase subunit A